MQSAVDIVHRIDELRAKLSARVGNPGYKRNVQALRAEIERLSQQEVSHGQT